MAELQKRIQELAKESAKPLLMVERDDGRRFVVHADEKLTAFVELE